MISGRLISACLLMLVQSMLTMGQEPGACDRKFIFHLVENKYFEEAVFLTDTRQCREFLNNDSIAYLRGWSYYKLNRSDSSIVNLMKVHPGSPLYLKAGFYSAYQFAVSGLYDRSLSILQKIGSSEQPAESLRLFEEAGVSLLAGDKILYENLLSQIEKKMEISAPVSSLRSAFVAYENHKAKSPALAGLMSAVIPGTGKLYAGHKGEAMASFISVAGLGLVTWESYRHNGIRNFGTLLAGAFFSFYYISNIYGSVFSIIVGENDFKDDFRKTVLLNLRVPLDNFFR